MIGKRYIFNRLGFVIALAIIIVPLIGNSQNIYSRKTGNWDDNAVGTGTWSLIGHGGIACACTPGALNTVIIGSGHTVTYRSATPAATTVVGITINDDVTGGSLVFGNGAGATSLTVTGDVQINAGGSFTTGGAGVNTHTLTIRGNLTNNNTFNTTGTANTVVFNGSAPRTISGTGSTYSFNNLTVNTTGANDINVNNSILINGVLAFSADGILVVNATSNITLGNAATITGPTSARYVQLDGSTGSASQLIKTSNGTTASWQILFPIGTSTGGYTPLDLTAAGGATITTNPTNNSTLAVKPIYNVSIPGQMRRQFRLFISGNAAATTLTNADFYYNTATDISGGDVQANYNTLWYLSTASGTWVNVTGTAPGVTFFTSPGTAQSLGNGTYYYAIGNSTAFTNVWYSYQTGVWSDPDVWTLDPSGTSLLNPLSQSPLNGDQVVILNGFTVTCDVNNITLSATTIQGGAILDIVATTGHNLGTVTGSGLLRIKSTTLPSGTYTSFVASTGGTIEYYDIGGSGTLSTTQLVYNKLKFTNSTVTNITMITASNLTVNGTFDITATSTGDVVWQINSDAAAVQRTIILYGDLSISAEGRISVGNGNEASTSPHAMTVYGNIVNNGIVKFYDEDDTELPEANYGNTTTGTNNIYTNELQGNAVNVTFSGTTDNTVTCNGTTDFYRFIVNKGTGQQAMVTVNSSSTSNFRLFGPTNIGSSGSAAAPNEFSENSLSIINGTLQLTGSINIPNLDLTNANDYFSIPQNGALWLNGSDVTVSVSDNNPANNFLTKRLMLSGMIRVTLGTLNAGVSAGIGSEDGGVYFQEGGTVTCWQFRPRAAGTGIFSFNMTGGTFNVGYTYGLGGGYTNDDYSRFDLNSANSTFQMSGGTLNIAKPTNNDGGLGGIFRVGSSVGNYSVTGGTINVYAGEETAGNSYPNLINTTAPIYNLNIYEESATTQTTQLQTNSLVVLNNLTINTGNTPSFVTNNLNVTIGGSFDILSGTTYTPGTGTTTFNGSGAQTWTHNGTITGLASVVVNKTTGTTLTLAGANTFPNITVALTLTSGTLADGGKTITVSGTGTLTNNATHSGAGAIDYTSTTATIGGNGGAFGNLTITTNATIATSGTQTITGTLRLVNANSTLNIGSNALTALGNIYSNASPGTAVAFTATKRILTSGFHNAGGLTRQGAAGDLLFPVGTGTLYTPNTVNVTATTHGTITVRPVSSEHPNVTTTAQGVRYYWRVTSSGYSGVTIVTHKSYDYSTATEDNPTANYRSARYDRTANTWATNNTTFNATASPPIPNFNTGTSWTGVAGDQLDGEYTCGNIAAFGIVTVYYSRVSGNWNVNSTWSTSSVGGPTASSNPTSCSTCPVIIGDGVSNNHTITTVANSSCGSLTLSTGSTLNCSTFTGHNFGTNTGGAVTGRGTLRIGTTGAGVSNMFPAGDFTNFLGVDGGTVEWFGATKTIPTTGPAPQNLSLANYYNLIINATGGNTITLPASNLTIYNNMTAGSNASFPGTVITNGSRTITISGDFAVSRGVFNFSNANPSVTTLTVGGNTSVANAASLSVVAGGTANTNTLSTPGSITNDGTINFNNTSRVNITFTGSNNVTFGGTGSGGTTLSLITVNKGSSQTPTVDFTVGGTVTAATSGWLTLTNGTFNWNNASTVTVSTASAAYSIPPTAKLRVSLGTVNVLTANNTAADLGLSGALEVSGGTVNIGNSANTIDNDIEYASAGAPTITVSSGTLFVNGSIRRSTSTITGALVYNQTGGAVTVGGKAANNTRGVFEIDSNTGSSFILTGASTLTVQRQTGGTGYADVFINPVTSNVSSTSTISVGLATATTQANLRVNIAPTIGNFTVLNGAGTNAQTVNMFSNPMILGGTLTIQSPSVLVTNSLDVTIAGNLSITGTGVYTGGTNTTTFNGTGAQAGTLSAGSTFTNMTVNKTAGTTITLSGTSPTITNLNILSGILDVGALNLSVQGDVVNNSSQIGAGTISLAGGVLVTAQNITSSGGSFQNLTLTGTATSKTVAVTGDMSINGTLNFATTNRYLNIGSYLLTFGSTSAITGAASTAFIKTNGSSSDLGVLKNWPTGVNTFTYAAGTRTNYTPVTFTSLNVSAAGDLTVIPVDDRHPTANTGSSENILNYYWIVTRGSTLSYAATGSHTYAFPTALLGGSGGTLAAGYLDITSATPGWITSTNGAVTPGGTATTTSMTWTNFLGTNLPTAGNTFHYAVGTSNTLPNPIVPVYSRRSDANVNNLAVGGDWNDTNSWTLTPGGFGPVWGSIPFGNSVVIVADSRINIAQSGRISFITQIDGLLVLPSNKVGHNLGILRGTGTMQTPINTFPAGNYTSFVSSAGGTIEYVGPMTMNNRSTYNNLSVIGTGNVTMTNTDLVLNGSVSIGATATLNNSTNNRNINLAGGWTTTPGGSFTAGTGTVTLSGTSAVNINGTTTFNNLVISKTGVNVTLAGTGATTVNNILTLTSGNLVTSSTHLLALPLAGTISGGSATSYISGPMTKVLTGGGSFNFPLGSISASLYRPASLSNTSGADTWTTEYVGSGPTTGGYPNTSFNGANIAKVSMFEYWNISRAGATSADLTISYNTGSYIPPDIGNQANLRVVRWDGTQWDLPPGAASFSTIGDNISGTVTVTNVTSFSPITFGSLDADSPLPVKWGPFDGRRVDNGVALRWITLQEVNNDHFEVERSEDGIQFSSIGTLPGKGNTSVQQKYDFLDSEASRTHRYYYRIRQVDFDGISDFSKVIVISPVGDLTNFWVAYPNPLKGEEKFVVEQADSQEAHEQVDVVLYSSQGIMIYKGSGTLDEVNARLDAVLHDARSGMYLLQISNSMFTENFRVIRH